MVDAHGEEEDLNHGCEGPIALAQKQRPSHTAFCADQGSRNIKTF